jgi:hypothetical protein
MPDEGADRLALRTMPYREYLRTAHWQRCRDLALKRAGYACQLCNGRGELHVHHRTYERRGAEIDADLIVLCKRCHQRFHDLTRSGADGLSTTIPCPRPPRTMPKRFDVMTLKSSVRDGG